MLQSNQRNRKGSIDRKGINRNLARLEDDAGVLESQRNQGSNYINKKDKVKGNNRKGIIRKFLKIDTLDREHCICMN